MYLDDIRDFCLGLGEVNEGFPFDKRTLVFKNPGGMFCLLDIEWEEKTLNLKCDPNRYDLVVKKSLNKRGKNK
jgi:predicted DNA-binding protein (MmcQ/YjbR family)